MSRAIEPIRPARAVPRRRREDGAATEVVEIADLRTSVAAPRAAPSPRGPEHPSANVEAHLLAQNAEARGLRGGPERLGAARSVYLGIEFSGPNDRRPRKGMIAKREA
ncbi:MAG TPA: hypothetical protein VMU93_01060 [Caulobacteraceae bacterium]|nr:hypothetical protein [Caulobacteraceae bacterium]